MITVRRATLDDLEAMIGLYNAAWREGFRHMFSATVFVDDGFDAERRAECEEAMRNENADTYVAEVDDYVVGFAVARVHDRKACLEDVWVQPHSWGSGAAAALVARIEDDLRSEGTRRLDAWVPEDSPTGRRFFEKIGWRATGRIELLDLYPADVNRMFEYERTLA